VVDITSERAKALNLKEERGVEVTSIIEEGPSAKAGIKESDVVLEYNGQAVQGTEQFQRLVRETPPGRQVKVGVWRNGAAQTITATVGERKGTVITSDDGAFEFKGLAPGKYSLEGARRGFITSAYDAHENYSTAIVTGGDTDSEHLVFRLTPQAVLTGKVLDEAGEAVRGASVSLYRQDQSTGVSQVRKVANAQCDDRGVYEVCRVAGGNVLPLRQRQTVVCSSSSLALEWRNSRTSAGCVPFFGCNLRHHLLP
jgi:hypothetical protein